MMWPPKAAAPCAPRARTERSSMMHQGGGVDWGFGAPRARTERSTKTIGMPVGVRPHARGAGLTDRESVSGFASRAPR